MGEVRHPAPVPVLERQLNGQRVRFDTGDRAFLVVLLQGLPPEVVRRMRR